MPSQQVSFAAPGSEYQADAERIARQRQYAQALQEQGMAPMTMPTQPGVRVSPLEGLAKMLKAYSGRRAMEAADEEAKSLAERQQARRGADISTLVGALQGRPASPGGLVEDASGNVTEAPATAALKPSQTLRQALPMIQTPEVQQTGFEALVSALKDEKPKEPRWAVQERFNPQGQPEKVLVDLNDPTNVLPFGGSKAQDPSALVVLGPDGKPMVNPMAVQARKEIAEAGRTNVTANPTVSVNTSDNEYLKARRKQQAEAFATLEKSAESAYKQIQTLDRFIEASEKGTAGGAQPIISGVQNFLASFGYSPESLKDVRVMEQAIGDILGNKMAELGARGLTDKDMEILRQALPRVNVDKASRLVVANILKKASMATLAEYENARGEEERIYPEFARKTPVQGWLRSYRESKKKSQLPEGVTQEEWNAMTAQERALFSR